MTTTLSSKTSQSSQPYNERADLLKSWQAVMRRYDWQEFSTLTFKHSMHDPVRIVQMANLWLTKRHFAQAASEGSATKCSRVKRDAYDRPLPSSTWYKGKFANFWNKGKGRPVWVMAIEPHKSGALHAHMLINFTIPSGALKRIEGTRIWKEEMKGGFCRVDEVRSQGAVNCYVAKYVLKGIDPEKPDKGWYNDLQFSNNFDAPAGLVS